MDSGLILDDEAKKPQFNPFTPLLPEEVCYILDRVIACEVRLPGFSATHLSDNPIRWSGMLDIPSHRQYTPASMCTISPISTLKPFLFKNLCTESLLGLRRSSQWS